MKPDYECSSNREPICPYCGKAYGDTWELRLNDGESEEAECDCGQSYRIECDVTVTYSTEPIEGWPEDESE